MILVDNALKAREKEGRPIRVALIGAGFMSQGLGNHIVNTMTGMRMVGVYNRKVQRAFDLCAYCGVKDVVAPTGQDEVDVGVRLLVLANRSKPIRFMRRKTFHGFQIGIRHRVDFIDERAFRFQLNPSAGAHLEASFMTTNDFLETELVHRAARDDHG